MAAGLAEHLHQLAQDDAPATDLLPGRRTTEQGVHVVGIACRLPGGARDKRRVWQLLKTGAHAVADLPAARARRLADSFDCDLSMMRRGGYLQVGAVACLLL